MPQMSDMVASEKELRQRDPDILRNGIRLILHELERLVYLTDKNEAGTELADRPTPSEIRGLICALRADANWLDGGETKTAELERRAASMLELILNQDLGRNLDSASVRTLDR